jgi:predicted AAA+ superfamily ATPase
VEVKLSSTVNAKDFTGLKLLEKAAGNRFKKGVVFYTGNEITPFGENLWALPVSYLWNGESSANPPAGATL